MDVRHVVLVSQSTQTDPDDVARVAAALNRQVVNDLARHWPVSATVHAFDEIDAMPLDSWLMVIKDDIDTKPGITGFHLSSFGLPYALIQYSRSWSLTASHELLEMLVDPTGSLLVTKRAPGGISLKKVQYLVEICDPCQDKEFSYTVNSVMVSDFITPQFYDPVASPGLRYSFQGQVTEPRTILRGGYLVFRDPQTGEMFEWTDPNRDPSPLGSPEGGVALRTWVDARTSHPDLLGVPEGSPELERARASEAESKKAREAIAEQLQDEIDQLIASA